MSQRLRCSDPGCGTWLNVELPDRAFALLTRFPEDLVRCLEQLALGVTVTLCPNGHENVLPGLALCVDHEPSFAILYIRPDAADHADDIESDVRSGLGATCRIRPRLRSAEFQARLH